ncbi:MULTISPECIES: hypothetical protein [unclassified Streptomyces]|uniref:hypothetical protein n=1 Tax=unclassified Streptomyces TaxID=2593676 RepID=UPI0009396FA1|nr:hypothetical protein [Streptomyces sp. TSRI0281]OKI42666.1 hypothetical protein A6A29_36030 [Streptomyces sp. TSRI0281]
MVRRWVPAFVLGGLWWWAVLRLVLEPEHAGLVEGAVAAGGWGLSLLPIHVGAVVRPGRVLSGAADAPPQEGAGGAGGGSGRAGTGDAGRADDVGRDTARRSSERCRWW